MTSPITSCPSTTGFIPTQAYLISGDCNIPGDVGFSTNGSLFFQHGTLTVNGDFTLEENAKVTIFSGTLKFPQLTNSQFTMNLLNTARLTFQNASLITNNGTENNFSMSLNGADDSLTIFNESSLNTNNNWLLGNFFGNAEMQVIRTLNLPTETYPNDASLITFQQSNFAGVWLNFNAGSNATLVLPQYNQHGVFSLTFGNTEGFDYLVKLENSYCRLGLNSYPQSTMIIVGNKSSSFDQINIVFGYYFQGNTQSVTVSNLAVGADVSQEYTDSGRLLQLRNVVLNPFSWQIYTSSTNGYNVTIENSIINEIASFTNGSMILKDSVLQLAVLEAAGSNARLALYNCDIWSQSIEAVSGGYLYVENSTIHGNFVYASGVGSVINFTSSTFDLHNGNATIPNCDGNSEGYTPNINGVPLCNPYNPLHRCSQVSSASGAIITRTPVCVPYPTESPTFAPSVASTIHSDSPTSSASNDSLSDGEIAGIAIGGMIGFLLFAAVAWLSWKRYIFKSAPAEDSGKTKLNIFPKSDA